MIEPRSHLADILLGRTLFLVRLRLTDPAEKKYFAYLALTPQELEALTKARTKSWFDPNQYGQLIVAGEGEPTPEIIEHIEKEYGFDHARAIDL